MLRHIAHDHRVCIHRGKHMKSQNHSLAYRQSQTPTNTVKPAIRHTQTLTHTVSCTIPTSVVHPVNNPKTNYCLLSWGSSSGFIWGGKEGALLAGPKGNTLQQNGFNVVKGTRYEANAKTIGSESFQSPFMLLPQTDEKKFMALAGNLLHSKPSQGWLGMWLEQD